MGFHRLRLALVLLLTGVILAGCILVPVPYPAPYRHGHRHHHHGPGWHYGR